MEFKVGDMVEYYSIKGTIVYNRISNVYPIKVIFEPVSTGTGNTAKRFTKDGKICGWDKEPSLKLVERSSI